MSWRLHAVNGINYWIIRGGNRIQIQGNADIVIQAREDGIIHLVAQAVAAPHGRLGKNTPHSFALYQGSPNPFNPTTQIRFDLSEASNVSLVIYDILGRRVTELVNGELQAGYHSATWDASSVASGVYFVRFIVTNPAGAVVYHSVNKALLMK